LKIWENRSTLSWFALGLIIIFLFFYLIIYLGLGSWIVIEAFKNNVLPRIIERNQEIEKILELMPK